jgi:hypothetical protein
VLELSDCLGLDLAYPLARHRKLLPDFLQRMVAVHAETKAHAYGAANSDRPVVAIGLLTHIDPRTNLVRRVASDAKPSSPNSGVISVVAVYSDGNVIEMATIGREGCRRSAGFFGARRSSARLLVQIPGSVAKMSCAAFNRATRRARNGLALPIARGIRRMGEGQKSESARQ